MTLTRQQQLNYLYKIQKLQQITVLKDDIHLTYQSRNRKRATSNIHTIQDKIHREIAENTLNSGYVTPKEIDNILQEHNVGQKVDDIISDTLQRERKRINKTPTRYVDAAVEKHSNE